MRVQETLAGRENALSTAQHTMPFSSKTPSEIVSRSVIAYNNLWLEDIVHDIAGEFIR